MISDPQIWRSPGGEEVIVEPEELTTPGTAEFIETLRNAGWVQVTGDSS